MDVVGARIDPQGSQVDFAMNNGIEKGSETDWEMRMMIKDLGPQLKENMQAELTRDPHSKSLASLIDNDEIQAQWLMQIISQRDDRLKFLGLPDTGG